MKKIMFFVAGVAFMVVFPFASARATLGAMPQFGGVVTMYMPPVWPVCPLGAVFFSDIQAKVPQAIFITPGTLRSWFNPFMPGTFLLGIASLSPTSYCLGFPVYPTLIVGTSK